MTEKTCLDCKYLAVYEGLDDNLDPTGEIIYICALSDEDLTEEINNTCEDFDEKPLFG